MAVDWDQAMAADLAVADLEQRQQMAHSFLPLPASAGKAMSYDDWRKDFAGWLFRTQKVELLKSPSTKEVSKPANPSGTSVCGCNRSGRKHGTKPCGQRLRQTVCAEDCHASRSHQAGRYRQRKRQQAESRSSQVQAAISVGASILGAFLGRKTISATNIGRATTAIRSAGRVMKESEDVGQAEENVAALQQQLGDLEAQFKSESDALSRGHRSAQREARKPSPQTHQSQYCRQARGPRLDAALAGRETAR